MEVSNGTATGANCPDADASHASILWSGGVESVWLTSLLFSCIVMFTLTWEYVTERLEATLEEHSAYKELLEKVYKELTMLGLLSFALFIQQDTSAVQTNLSMLHAFEFAHYLIFFMAMIFVLFALVSMRGCLASKRQWDSAAGASLHAVCDAYTKRLRHGQTSCWSGMLRHIGVYDALQLSFSHEQQNIEWFILRVMFLREYGVQIHFNFSKYTRKSLTNAIMRGVSITPATWAFMLGWLLMFAAADLVHKADYSGVVDPDSTRRRLAASGGFTPVESKIHVLFIGCTSWFALFVQMGLVLMLRRRQRQLLQRKLHMLNFYEDLIPKLKEGVQLLQMEASDAETHGHNHLQLRHESIDERDDIRLSYEGQIYSVTVQNRVLWVSHCTSMWSCFSLAYYCMDLVTVVGKTDWSTLEQTIAHAMLILPHAALVLRTTPALMKHEALLSCVVRRSDELVATVASGMERDDRLCESLRCKLVDAHRQHKESIEEPSTPITAALRLKASSTQELQQLEFTPDDVDSAARWLFAKISSGDLQIGVRKLRVGLHWINAYFTNSQWKSLCRLFDRNHNFIVRLEDLLTVLAKPGQGYWRPLSVTGSVADLSTDLEAGPTTGHKIITPDEWMFENVDDINTEVAAIAAVPLFAVVAKASGSFMKDLSMELERRRVPVGEIIIRKGDVGKEMYFLTRGTVEVLVSLASQPVRTMSGGCSFGETALISSEKRNAYIRASEGVVDSSVHASGEAFVELYVLSNAGLQKTLARYPNIKTSLEADAKQRTSQLDVHAGPEPPTPLPTDLREVLESKEGDDSRSFVAEGGPPASMAAYP